MVVSAIISNLTSYKIISIFGIEASLGTFTMPFILMLLNPIAEIYGGRTAKQVLFTICFSEILFAVCFHGFSHIQQNCSASTVMMKNMCEELNDSYLYISEHVIRGSVSFTIGCFVGGYINTKYLLHLKKMWSSKLYFLRDIFSSIIGETVYVIICFLIAFYGIFPISTIIQIMSFSLIFKFLSTIPLSGISQFIVFLIKEYKSTTDSLIKTQKVVFSSRYIEP